MSFLRPILKSGIVKELVFQRYVATTCQLRSDVKYVAEVIETPKITIEEKDNISSISGIPEEQLNNRQVRIFSPAKNAMQSGTFKTNKWFMEFNTQERWENPLMGWCSTADPLAQIRLSFSTKEDAIAFCEKNNWRYSVEEKHSLNLRPKVYGDNFSWNKKTRVSTK
ncbi:hypothetical protein HELRODRAFT_180765 [Helobdella robusta]|uniref:NADH dehydrogenase [ubiquinone] iron-sulfur protein 4, mitochondrial n=1 Tax=Helobdella robusta TaxID=6412 RepID=T1FG90_HELRO|nr:hypothetical protein HELRODRAFT_180765 [Helobdella robusta]ESN93670.1 hypothetical protein HELRODRAFT_180765 [Helobdella robusta]